MKIVSSGMVAIGAALLIAGTAAAHYLSPRGVHPGGELAPSRLTTSAAGKITIGNKARRTWLSPGEFHPVGDPRACGLVMVGVVGGQQDFLYRNQGTCTKYVARLPVPEGAYLGNVTGYGFDDDQLASMVVGLEWPQLTASGSIQVQTQLGEPSVGRSSTTMYPDTFGLANAGTLVDFQHRIPPADEMASTYPMVVLIIPASESLSFIGVEVGWRPTYGTSVAAPTFSDVPAAHAYSNEVESFARAGISGGCGGGRFCVDAPVTRGQMAVFLSRALGLYDETANDPPAQ